jgi:hypothetical protein
MLHREPEGPVTDRSADVQDADAARSPSANSRVARTSPELQFPTFAATAQSKDFALPRLRDSQRADQ